MAAPPNPKHFNKLRKIADDYAAAKGLGPISHSAPEAKVKVDRAKKIAQAFEDMKHDPNNPEVKAAYDALIKETADQYQMLRDSGLKVTKITPEMGNPYKTSADMIKDVTENNHLYYFPTESGFGTEVNQFADHPLLQKIKVGDEEMPANDLFRIVHDYFGHAKEGAKFGARGEENAWREHMKMFSPQARKAMTSETRGQNSWVNFGPHGEANRANPANTKYADQKAGLLPDWAYDQSFAARNKRPSLSDISPFNGITKAYNLYDKHVQQPVSDVADSLAETVVSGTTPLTGEDKKKFVEENKPIVSTGFEMAMDPLNLIGLKTPAMTQKIISRKEASKYLETAMKRAADEGKSVGQVVSDMLLGKMPWRADMESAKQLELQRQMMRDVVGHSIMEAHGVSDAKGIARAVKDGIEKTAPGFPQDKVWMVNPVGGDDIFPRDEKAINALLKTRDQSLGSLAKGAHTGDVLGMQLRADRLPKESQTAHQLVGLVGHELGHAQDAVKFGPASNILEKPFDPSVLSSPGETLGWRLDRASRSHHLDNPQQTIEKTIIDKIAKNEQLYPDLQTAIPKYSGDEAEAQRLLKLFEKEPQLRDQIEPAMRHADRQSRMGDEKQRFERILQLINPKNKQLNKYQ